MKKEIPLALGIIFGLIWFGEFFVAGIFYENFKIFTAEFFKAGGAVGLIVGAYSVFLMNYNKIKYNNDRWYAVLQLTMIAIMLILGFLRGYAPGTPFDSVYENVYIPFVATMFSILAFYIASAAFRSFKAKTIESALMLIAATIVMLGKIPIGEHITEYIPLLGEWILDSVGSAGRRAINFGSYLGALTMLIRIFFGLERSHISE